MAATQQRPAWAALLALLSCPHLGTAGDQTDITQRLNSMVARGPDFTKVYSGGGYGVMVRNPFDGYEDDVNKQVVPATFLHNDIFSGNKVFPSFDAKTGMDFETPPMFYIIGSGMHNIFYEFDKVQSDTWGWGVFYPWDSNAADARCRWLSTYNTYDCPGYAITWGQKPKEWPQNKGAGAYPAGNPRANPNWGGGAGCHFSGQPYGCHDPVPCIFDIDQANRSPKNLVQDQDCQCNYIFKDNWSHWVEALGQVEGNILPEAAMCWVNNPRDLINLQNALWWHRKGWFTSEGQTTGPTGYWGWNEIPISRKDITNPANWDAVVIKMPVFACGHNGGDDVLDCITKEAGAKLEATLDQWITAGKLLYGIDNIAKRPGSYVVLHREWKDQSDNFFSWFFCQSWTSPNGKYAIRFREAANGDTGFCYLDKLKAEEAPITV